jgi:hypothetical protein
MKKSFLSTLAADGPIAVIDDRVYRVSREASASRIYINAGGYTTCLEEGERILVLENQLAAPQVAAAVEQVREKLEKNTGGFLKELKSMQSRAANGMMEEFIAEFLRNWSPPDEFQKEAMEAEQEDKGDDNLDELVKDILDGIKLHSFDDTPLLDLQTERAYGTIIINDKVYHLAEGDVPEGASFVVDDDKNKFSLIYISTLKGFEREYIRNIGKSVTALKHGLEQKQAEQFQRLRNEKSRKLQATGLAPEDPTGEVGWIKDGSSYYVYINRGSYILESKSRGKKYRFPSCRLAVRLITAGGKVDYDRDLGEGQVRIIASKQVRNGVEVGEMTSTKERDYRHPATSSSLGGFQRLCTGDYKFPAPTESRSLEDCIVKVLLKACDLIESGYKDVCAGRKSAVYRPFDSSEHIKIYKEHEIR